MLRAAPAGVLVWRDRVLGREAGQAGRQAGGGGLLPRGSEAAGGVCMDRAGPGFKCEGALCKQQQQQ